jgi:hypothetical protein
MAKAPTSLLRGLGGIFVVSRNCDRTNSHRTNET